MDKLYTYVYADGTPLNSEGGVVWSQVPTSTVTVEEAVVYPVELAPSQIAAGRAPKVLLLEGTVSTPLPMVDDGSLSDAQHAARLLRSPEREDRKATVRVECWLNSIAELAAQLQAGVVELKLATKLRVDAESGIVDPDWSSVIGTLPKDRSAAGAAAQLLA